MHVFASKRGRVSLRDLLPRSRKVVSTERFREVLTDIRDKLKSGVALSDAFASYGEAFPPIYATSLRAGERSGDLEGVLRRFLKYQKMMVALRKRVITALIYPSILIVMSFSMVIIMLTKVIPRFAEFYAGFNAELPAFTRLLITIANALNSHFLIAVTILAILILLLRQWVSTTGRVAWDRFKLRLPFAGGVLHRVAVMPFTQSLGTLLSGGTPMVPAIEIASQSITNQMVSAKVSAIVQNVREGEPLWRSLEDTKVITDLAVEMIKVGESTGALTEMLANVSEFYDEEIEARLARIVAAIEPIILVFMGGVIAVLLYAFYLPLFQLTAIGQQ